MNLLLNRSWTAIAVAMHTENFYDQNIKILQIPTEYNYVRLMIYNRLKCPHPHIPIIIPTHCIDA